MRKSHPTGIRFIFPTPALAHSPIAAIARAWCSAFLAGATASSRCWMTSCCPVLGRAPLEELSGSRPHLEGPRSKKAARRVSSAERVVRSLKIFWAFYLLAFPGSWKTRKRCRASKNDEPGGDRFFFKAALAFFGTRGLPPVWLFVRSRSRKVASTRLATKPMSSGCLCPGKKCDLNQTSTL